VSEPEHPSHLPVLLDVAGRSAVVVGGGLSALGAASSLVRHGAKVVIIAPRPSDELLRMRAEGLLAVKPRDYVRGDLESAFLAVADSGSAETDVAVANEAEERNVLISVGTDAAASSFMLPPATS
jgi:siroheme synthase-like protein